jgi:hypothetical protein
VAEHEREAISARTKAALARRACPRLIQFDILQSGLSEEWQSRGRSPPMAKWPKVPQLGMLLFSNPRADCNRAQLTGQNAFYRAGGDGSARARPREPRVSAELQDGRHMLLKFVHVGDRWRSKTSVGRRGVVHADRQA